MVRRGAALLSRNAVIAGVGLGLVAWTSGCHQRAFVAGGADGGVDGAAADAQAPLTLDISITGCATLDLTTVTCSGPAPLTLSFAPVGSAALTMFLWTFGDGTPSSKDPAPTHVYAVPGTYDVSLTGDGLNGDVSTRPRVISVLPVGAGAACDVDSQCGPGLRCFCQSGAGCAPAFTRGICTTACATGFCGAGAVCAEYALPAPAVDAGSADAGDGGSGAGLTATCLADCSSASCAPGFVCQRLRAGGQGASGWIQGCLPLGAANDFGASCRDATGALDDASCTTGLCADLGTLGMCSAICDETTPCPPGGGCARLPGSATPLCLPSCSAAAPCAHDPAIGCAAATAAGAGIDGGVPIISGALNASYCAPR